MHICSCAPTAERISLYTVTFTFAFSNLDPVVYDVPMDPEEFGGLSACHILLCRLGGLCALCTPFSLEGDTLDHKDGATRPLEAKPATMPRRSGKKGKEEGQTMLVGDAQGSKGMAEAIDNAQSILESVLREAKTAGAENAARSGIFGRELYLYVP
jgi:hypothetical protein